MIAVVDIDGVLADAAHREHHLRGPAKDWDAFFAAVGEDPAIEAGLALVADLAREHDLVLLSGRPERTRADTHAWLERHGIRPSRLILRPDDDRRPAAQVKAELIRSIGGPQLVAVVVDDDERILARLDALGYRTRHFG